MADIAAGKKENHFLRVECAIFLFFISYTHYRPEIFFNGYNVNNVIFAMGRFAIPVFFLISGYFTFSKDGHSEKRLFKKLLHIVYLLIFFKLFYLFLDLFYLGFGFIDVDYLLRAFFVSEVTTQPAWFLYSLILVYLIWNVLYRFKMDFKITWYIGVPILILDLALSEFIPLICGMEPGSFGHTCQHYGTLMYPFLSIPFFTFGYYMHKNRERLDQMISNRMIVLALVFGTLLTVAEVFPVLNAGQDQCNLFISSLVLGFALFYGSFRLREDQLRNRPLEFIGREMMPWFYTFFMATNYFTYTVLFRYVERHTFLYEGLGPFIAIAINLVMSFAMCRLLKRINGRKKGPAVEQEGA